VKEENGRVFSANDGVECTYDIDAKAGRKEITGKTWIDNIKVDLGDRMGWYGTGLIWLRIGTSEGLL
jgi:hypothetical protein